MARYKIEAVVSETNIRAVKAKLAAAFTTGEESISATKIEDSPSRADRLSAAESLVEQARSVLDDLKSEMEEWHDNIPENLQQGDKAQEVQEAIDGLDTLCTEMEALDFGGVTFPSAF